MVIDPGNNSIKGGLKSSVNTAESNAKGVAAKNKVDTGANADNSRSSASDSVSLSSAGQSIAKIEANLAASPEVDSEKVARIKSEIASGNYQVDANAIADKMLQDEQIRG